MAWFPDMWWLAGEILLWMLLAALLGLLIGWLLWRRPGRVALEESESRGRRLESDLAEAELRSSRTESELRTEVVKVESRSSRISELEVALDDMVAECERHGHLVEGLRSRTEDLAAELDECRQARAVITAELSVAQDQLREDPIADEFEHRMSALAASRDLTYHDDLKEISGVGPMLEKMLNENGLRNFYQIAHLEDASIDALDARLKAFPGRIRRDDWVVQARVLHRDHYQEAL